MKTHQLVNNIRINQCPNINSKSLLTVYIDMCLQELGICTDILINVFAREPLIIPHKGLLAYCAYLKYTHNTFNHIEIALHPYLNKKQLLVSLAHECVHAKQYLLGELIIYSSRDEKVHAFWHGYRVNFVDPLLVTYQEQEKTVPYEVEAYNLQYKIARNVIKRMKQIGYQF